MKFWEQYHLYVDKVGTKFQVEEMYKKEDMQDLPTWGSCEKSFTFANFDTLPRIEEIAFARGIFGVKTSLC